MSMRTLMAGAAGGLMIALGAVGSNTVQAQETAFRTSEQQFINRLAAENLVEVRLGQTAQTKAANTSVKQFAQRMVVDHTSMQKQWMALAKKNDFEFKADPNTQQIAQVEQLRNLSGAEFDRQYMGMMVQSHRNNVNLFQNELRVGHSAEFRQLIQADLARLQEHLTLAQQIGGQVGSDMTAAAGTPTDTTSVVTTPPGQQPQPGQPTPQVGAQGTDVRADSVFINDLNAANNATVRFAQLAASKASEPGVRQLAQKMITGQDWLQKQWRELAWRNGLAFSSAIRPQQQEQLAQLQRLSGKDFDRAYVSTEIQNHQSHVNALQTRGRAAQSAAVRDLAARSLPYFQQQLTSAQQVASRIGADTVGTIAADTGRGDRGNVRADAKFIRNVDASHFLQVRLGRLAQEKGRDSDVKRFGERMERDHGAFQEQWNNMASRNNMPYKSGMGPEHKSELDRLEKLSGRAFDRAYMTFMIQSHNGYLNYWRNEGRSARSAPVRTLVNRGLPTLEEHMEMARRIATQVGVNPNAALAGRRIAERAER
ncbi:MAG TPA: DUF4142 domain-containing protein [Gemmatimonadales bacterium]|nr:DUF4142 domain-containing protein [Gemmatimonadales bacterium]